jgi:ABC-type lipoprotein release transport system permease subunit
MSVDTAFWLFVWAGAIVGVVGYLWGAFRG